MRMVFVDTGAWYALMDKGDRHHQNATDFLLNNSLPLLTTNFIFDETITLLRTRHGWNTAKEFGRKLKDSDFASLMAVREEDEERAWEIFLKYNDHDFSYTDCTSFAVMQRMKVDTAFTFDGHFETMKFHVVPHG